MANLTDIIKVTASQYNTLISGGTVSGRTYDANALYLVEDSSSVVNSVNGQTGTVTLDYDDVNAAPAVSGGYLPKSGGTMTGTITTPINSGAAIQFRDESSYRSGIAYRADGNEAVCFENNYSVTSWIFRTKNPATNSGSWSDVTPSLQIKNQKVAINKLIASGSEGAYNLDVNGTANATTITVNAKVTMQYNSSEDCLDFIFA